MVVSTLSCGYAVARLFCVVINALLYGVWGESQKIDT